MRLIVANLSDFDKIVLVGCDGVGKTTIAKKLESLGHKYVKCSHSDGDDKKALSLALLDELKHCDKIVFDRFYFPDDIIYSDVVSNVNTNADDWLEVYNRLVQDGYTIILLEDDFDNITHRFLNRGDDYVDVSMLNNIINAYNNVLSKFDHVRINVNDVNW